MENKVYILCKTKDKILVWFQTKDPNKDKMMSIKWWARRISKMRTQIYKTNKLIERINIGQPHQEVQSSIWQKMKKQSLRYHTIDGKYL